MQTIYTKLLLFLSEKYDNFFKMSLHRSTETHFNDLMASAFYSVACDTCRDMFQ